MTRAAEAPASTVSPLQRCCTTHADWAELAQHLLTEYPEASIGDIVREVRRAREAVETVTLPPGDDLHLGETIARYQLMLITGRAGDVARLDPESHQRS